MKKAAEIVITTLILTGFICAVTSTARPLPSANKASIEQKAVRDATTLGGTAPLAAAEQGKRLKTSYNEGDLIEYFIIFYPSISPNGDGIQDSSPIKVRPVKLCDLLSLTLEDTLSGNTIDTLLSVSNPDTVEYDAVWDGTDSLGALLPEGCYKLHLYTSSDTATENSYRYVFVDTTTPLVHLDRIEPGIYTPGVPGTPENIVIYYTLSGFSTNDSLRADVTDSKGATEEMAVAGKADGHYSVAWSTSESAPDGFYTASFAASDDAGNKSGDAGTFEVDNAPPAIVFIDSIPSFTNNPADFIEGSCFDRNGVKDLSFVWGNTDTIPPDTTYTSGDTLIWALNISDSIKTNGTYIEKQYSVKVLCSDTFGHEGKRTLVFTIDTTPPPAPDLDAIPSSSLEREIAVSGSADQSEADSVIVYYTNGLDTLSISKPLIVTQFTATVELFEGTTTVWAITKDKAGNISTPSGIFTVEYRQEDEYSFPEVFRGPDHFVVYTKEPAQSVEVQIFSIDGGFVRKLSNKGPATRFDLEWNLLNGDGVSVRNGPYLVVFTVRFNSSQRVDKKLIAVVK